MHKIILTLVLSLVPALALAAYRVKQPCQQAGLW